MVEERFVLRLWWQEIGIEAGSGDISPLMLSQAIHLFKVDLVMADSQYMPFNDHIFDSLVVITYCESIPVTSFGS